MLNLRFGRHALGIGVAILLLAGCGGTQSQLSPPVPVAHNAITAETSAIHPNSATIILVGTGWVSPQGIAVDGKGNVYVSDYQLGEVRKVSPPFTGRTHGKIRVVAQGLDSPTRVALDGNGNVYVLAGGTILQITPSGVKNTVATLAAFGIAADASQDVYAAADKNLYFIRHKPRGGWEAPVKIGPGFSDATEVARDVQGNLYIVDSGVNGVKKLEPSGKLLTVGSGFIGLEGVAIPLGCKATCSVYVSDADHNAVKKVSPPFKGPTHGKITNIGYGFSGPLGVAARGTDVYVVDGGNVQVKEVIP
jgi:hypothetical protein